MRLNELNEALRRLKDVNIGHDLVDNFEEIKGIVEEYSIDYNFEEIITQEEALDRIAELCSYGSIRDVNNFINDCGDYDLYRVYWDELNEVDSCDLDNIRDEIVDIINEEIEKEKQKALRDKLLFEIQQFFIENQLTLEGGVDKLIDRLIDRFEISLKERENECVRNNE